MVTPEQMERSDVNVAGVDLMGCAVLMLRRA